MKCQFREVTGRSLKDFDESAFRDDILGIDLEGVFSDPDPNFVWEKIYNHICRIIDVHYPIRTLRITIGKPDYLTDHILALMKQRDKAFRAARRFGTL